MEVDPSFFLADIWYFTSFLNRNDTENSHLAKEMLKVPRWKIYYLSLDPYIEPGQYLYSVYNARQYERALDKSVM